MKTSAEGASPVGMHLSTGLMAASDSGIRKPFLRMTTHSTGTGWWSRLPRSTRWHLRSRRPRQPNRSKGLCGLDPENQRDRSDRRHPGPESGTLMRLPPVQPNRSRVGRCTGRGLSEPCSIRRFNATGAMATAMGGVRLVPSIVEGPTRITTGATEPIRIPTNPHRTGPAVFGWTWAGPLVFRRRYNTRVDFRSDRASNR
jgi:hypothetical protein